MRPRDITRLNTRALGHSYIGNEDEEEDFRCAAKHGTIGVKMIEVVGGTGVDTMRGLLALTYTNQGSVQIEADTMTLLIPDRDRENREDFIWCVPIERQKWNKWYKLSEKFKTATPKEHGGVRYMNRMEGKNVKTILVMPNAQQSDDDAVTACAYLRMIKGMTCRMYVVRCTDDPLTGARLIERAAGADITLVEDMELEGEEDESSA